MGFTEVQSLDCDQVIALGGADRKTKKANAKSIEGYFLGSKKTVDEKKKSGVGYIHVFQTKTGNIGVWGKTDLDRKLLTVAPGSMTRVTHTGFAPTKNGEMYKYKVEVDSENTITVASLSEASVDETASEDLIEESYEESDLGSEEEALDEVVAPAPKAAAKVSTAKAPSAAASARVQEILSRRSAKSA